MARINPLVARTEEGMRFSRLVVLGAVFRVRIRYFQLLHYVVCQCDCGKVIATQLERLHSGRAKSCGCYHRAAVSAASKTHGLSKTRLHTTWLGMRCRCNNPNAPWYRIYGGRGIRVCEEWNSFESFREWALSNGYADDLTIDRINNDGNYEPNNCRWTTTRTQANNRSNNVFVSAFGERKTLSEWSVDSRCTVSRSTIEDRIRRGVDAEIAITFQGVIPYTREQ